MYVYAVENKLVDFIVNTAHNDAKFKAIRASVKIDCPFRVFWEEGFMLYMHFAPLGKGQWAVTGKQSQIAEVTVGLAHCAVTPTKGHGITPDERVSMGVFMQEACPNGRKCGRCPERC